MTTAKPASTPASFLREEEFKLTDTLATGRDIGVDLNKDTWQDLWRYQVPVGFAYVFQPHHRFSTYIEYLVDTLDLFLNDDGGVITDDTTDANDAGAGDVLIWAAAAGEAENDAIYIGKYYPFAQVGINLGTLGVGTTAVWEYYTGSAWATIPGTTDGTTLLTADGTLAFQPPTDWARTTVDGKTAFWIRLRVTAAPNYTTSPIGDQLWINGSAAGAGRAIGNWEQFRLEVRDASENQRYPLFSLARYQQLTEFQDKELRFMLPLNEPVIARERYWIVVQARPKAGVFDVSNSYFELECKRVRKALFEG